MTPIIRHLAEISGRYDVLYCDLWGCLHNGQQVFPDAVAALQGYRQAGGIVVLVTNSPRPRREVIKQLAGFGAPEDCYDDISTSGDAAQRALARGDYGRKVYHIGPERDLPFFADRNGVPFDVERVPLDEAEGVVCTGLVDDDTETPEDYRLVLMRAKSRGLRLLCANPDIVVDVGDKRKYCAGALAEFYTHLGGQSDYYGKPHPPIYALARRRAEEQRGGPVDEARILCVGDGIHTDIKGGLGENLDTLFITGGLAAEETGTATDPDPQKLAAYVAAHRMAPTYAIGFLR